jgi:hypothetical protein
VRGRIAPGGALPAILCRADGTGTGSARDEGHSVVGTYRRDGVVDTLVDAVLEGARAAGAETRKSTCWTRGSSSAATAAHARRRRGRSGASARCRTRWARFWTRSPRRTPWCWRRP